ncbi:MAG: SUMF1/EgtB/PvdO family nonheme iron enzyme, partial [Planctomycetes bacterium]|nr:SUMF1/EgtB/PvdO family nonheme iron enzyme [Planctomycetota bacterium]
PESARPENLPALRARLAEFERVVAERGRLQAFLDRKLTPLAGSGWAAGVEATTALREVVKATVERIDAIQRPCAELAQLRSRIAWAENVEQQTVAMHASAWQRVRAEVLADDRFDKLDLRPQPGLIPLRRHPKAFLQEFALQLPGGQMPQLDANGNYTIGANTFPVFVLLPGGTFLSGSQNQHPDQPRYDPLGFVAESPLQSIEVPPLFVSEFELTDGQWGLIAPTVSRQPRPIASTAVAELDRRQMLPALYAWGMRVPTCIEWEHCARGGTETPYWCGAVAASVRGHANVYDAALRGGRGEGIPAAWDDGFPTVAPVGVFGHNAFMMYDVHGNIAEVVVRSSREGQPPVLELRGGSWHQGPEAARITWKIEWHGQPLPSIGCRPVIDVVP